MPTPPKSTVRQRKKGGAMSTQRFVPIAEIRNDTVLLKNGGMRAIVQVEALNFNLKSETEQQGIIAGYGQFVNTLTFPLQVVMRSTKANIDPYLESLLDTADKQKNELLRSQTVSYVSFIQRLLDVADIMQKRFLVIVPLDRTLRKKTLLEQFLDWLHPADSATKASARNREFAQYSKELYERVELVQTGLLNIGLHSKRLNTRELLELYYQIYNPTTSQREKIPQDTTKLELDQSVL